MVSGLGAETPPRPAHRPTAGLPSPPANVNSPVGFCVEGKAPFVATLERRKGRKRGDEKSPVSQEEPRPWSRVPSGPHGGRGCYATTLRGRHEHLRCPVSRRRVHPTSPVSCCPGPDDSQCLLSLRNAAIPTVPNTTRSAGPSVLAPLFVPVTPHTNTNASVIKRPRRDTGHYYDI